MSGPARGIVLGFILPDRNTFPHFSVSAAMSLLKAADVIDIGALLELKFLQLNYLLDLQPPSGRIIIPHEKVPTAPKPFQLCLYQGPSRLHRFIP
jgi:hypothetical protein